MRLAKVIGTVVATRKEDSLIGLKLLVIEEIDPQGELAKDNRAVLNAASVESELAVLFQIDPSLDAAARAPIRVRRPSADTRL